MEKGRTIFCRHLGLPHSHKFEGAEGCCSHTMLALSARLTPEPPSLPKPPHLLRPLDASSSSAPAAALPRHPVSARIHSQSLRNTYERTGETVDEEATVVQRWMSPSRGRRPTTSHRAMLSKLGTEGRGLQVVASSKTYRPARSSSQ